MFGLKLDLSEDFFLIEIQSIHNVVFISGGQHSDSVTCVYVFLSVFFFSIGHYKALNIVPCAIQ